MNDFGAVYGHSTLLNVKDTFIVAHHFAFDLPHRKRPERLAASGLQCTGKPAAGKMAPGSIASTMLGKPSGDMMTGRTDDEPATLIDCLRMDDTQPAILIHYGAHFQLGLDRFYLAILSQQGFQTTVYRLFRGLIDQVDAFLTQSVLERLL